jgi:hypothetical protein
MPECYDEIGQEKNVDREELISVCTRVLESLKWQILDISMENSGNSGDYAGRNAAKCTIEFDGGSLGRKRWGNKGQLFIVHSKQGYDIGLHGSCSIFAKPHLLHNYMFELLKELKVEAFSIREKKKVPVPDTPKKVDKSPSKVESSVGSISDELEKLASLLEKGILTKAEFTQAKKKLLK